MKRVLTPECWGLHTARGGELMVGNHGAVGIARKFGTPLHVIHEERLLRSAHEFLRAASGSYRGTVSVHYAMKCNAVPAVVDAVLAAGLRLEVMTESELLLAQRCGCPGAHIIVNGPCKTARFLRACIAADVRLIIVDSLEELRDVDALAAAAGTKADVLLRVNPDFVPRGIRGGSATGSRRGCAFGLDLRGGEVAAALRLLCELHHTRFRGLHMHVGTGIRRPDEYARAVVRLRPAFRLCREMQQPIGIVDVGGGFAAATAREMRSVESLFYQVFGRLPAGGMMPGECPVSSFTRTAARAIEEEFGPGETPELIFEPGRSIASGNQFLLLTVHRVKNRAGAGRWLIADGGLSTVTLPTYYECHEVFLCNDVRRPVAGCATIVGPACFAGDVVYRNKPMPPVEPGDVLAVMDSGAYFTALESSFGFPRPAIVAVRGAQCRLVRSREQLEEMNGRDLFD
jgi:diaminopimelate decarboxylase